MTTTMIDPAKLPRVTDLVMMPELAELTGMSRQTTHKWMVNGYLETAKRLGRRPIFVVDADEVRKILTGKHPVIKLPEPKTDKAAKALLAADA